MKISLFFLSLFVTTSYCSSPLGDMLSQELLSKWKLNKSLLNNIEKGHIYSDSKVYNLKNEQVFEHFSTGFHSKTCSKSLRKLAMYEEYKNMISFIKTSTYNKKRKLLTLKADHFLLPFPMIVDVIVGELNGPGVYPFRFPTGMFKGLKGKLTIHQNVDKKRCLYFVRTYWKGPQSRIPNKILEFFSSALTKKGAEVMFRMTSHNK